MTAISSDARMLGLPPRLLWGLLIAIAAAAVLTAAGTWGWFTDHEDTDSTGELVFQWLVALVAIVIGAAIVGYTGIRTWRGDGGETLALAALIFGILAVLSIPAFWLGIYAPFGVGAGIFGLEGHRRGVSGGRRAMAWIGIALAALALVAGILANLFG